MATELTLLGTGTPTPLVHRAGSSYLVKLDDESILVDCGPGAVRRLLKKGVSPTTINTLLQTSVPDELRGRVLSFQTMMWGVTGLAGFHTGAIASAVGAPVAIAIGGGVVILNSLRIFRHRRQLDAIPAQDPPDSEALKSQGDQPPS